MSLIISIAAISVWLFGLLLLAAQALAHIIGYRIGARARNRGHSASDSVSALVAGMLGLLAFVLALTLSFANERFTERRAGTLAETNAIGTAFLRAKAVGGPDGEAIARLFETYVETRADFIRAGHEAEKIEEINRRTEALQTQIWSHVSTIVREKPNPVSVSLMTAVNEAFDASAAERFAFSMQLPWQFFSLLIALTLIGAGALAYQLGLRGKEPPWLVFLLMVMWSAVIVSILDLATARLGGIRTDATAYEWTRQSFAPPQAP